MLALLLLAAAMAPAQTGTASLRGVVADPSASVVPDAAVTVSNEQGNTQTVRTDAQGKYQLNGLAPGAITVRVAAPGFNPWEQAGSVLAAGQTRTLDIALALEAQAEQVTVAESGAAAIDVEPSDNAGALVMQKSDLDSLPDDPDDLTADLENLAGPAAGPDGGQFFIDGFTGGRMPPKQSIREIRINQNPFAAQFDYPGQGRVEILTKPGSDEFHGDVLFQYSDAAFNSRNPFVTTKPPYQRRQFEGELAGPIGKKTSYYLDFERRDISDTALVNALVPDANLNTVPFTQAVVTPLTGMDAEAKVDHQLSTNHTLTARYDFGRDTNDNNGVGGFSLPSRGYHYEDDENVFQAIETGVLNQHTVNETRFRLRHVDTSQSGGTTAPVISVLDAFSMGGSSVGNSFDRQNRYELQNSTSYVNGSHSVRVGGVARGVTLTDQAMQNYAGSFSFTSLAAYRLTREGIAEGLTPQAIRAEGGGASQFSLAGGNPLASLSQFDWGLYAQDDWRIRPGLTISGGLRWEAQTNAHDWTDLGPRLGFAWAPGTKKGTDSKNVIRGGFGIFYSRLSETLTLAALRQNGIRQQQFLIENPDFYPNVPAAATLTADVQPQTIRETDAHWQAPMLLQSSIGYERQLPKHVTLAANYMHSIGVHTLRSRNINAPVPGTGVMPYGGMNAIYLYETSGEYRQNQLVTSVNGRVNANFTFSGSWVLGSAHSNSDGSGTFPDNQYNLAQEYSRAGFDIRNRFQLSGSLTTKHGIRFSPFVTITSGRPFNITTGTDLNGDGLYTDRPAYAASANQPGAIATPWGIFDPNPQPGETIIPRNLGNGPGLIAVNLRVAKIIQLSEPKPGGQTDGRQLVLSVNARNILNHPNYAQPDGNLSSPLFGVSTALTSGGNSSGNRRLDLQARLNF